MLLNLLFDLLKLRFQLLKARLSLVGRVFEVLPHFLRHSFHLLTTKNIQLCRGILSECAGKLLD